MARNLSVLAVVVALVASVVGVGVVATPGSAQSSAAADRAAAATDQVAGTPSQVAPPANQVAVQDNETQDNGTQNSETQDNETADDQRSFDRTTVSVSATGTVSAQPDSAAVQVASTARASNASEATEQLAANVSTLRDALVAAGVPEDGIRTTDFQVFQQRDQDENATYVARQSFEVTVANTSDVGRVIDVAVANGATDVFGVEFQLSPERQQELRSQAIDLAIQDAGEQGAAVASSANLTLGTPRSISVSSGGFGPFVERADLGTDIDVSPVSVTASVQVTYNATAN